MNNSQINYQGRNPLPATPFCASHFASCETEICIFELILTSLSRLKMLEILSHGIQISNFSMGAYSQTPSRSVLLCNMPCLLFKHNFHSATYSVQIIHLLHSLMTTLHYIIFFIWSNPQNKLFVIKMLHDPWAQVIKLMCFHANFVFS